jgi:hypothetical protein
MPKENVEHIWNLATAGDLLNPTGWQRVSGFYHNPGPWTHNREIQVMSNYYGIHQSETKGNEAIVEMEYVDLGRIDSNLKYIPPKKTLAFKTGLRFNLIFTPRLMKTYGADGKTLIKEQPTGESVWVIQGPLGLPWTTVNTAIRYVLEMRDRATDPLIKSNADETLTRLKEFH